ncbi:MAG: response regulator [Lachnospiraceae bacterium]|nr:response regulator [Lachnospiraceae bacterium]
MFRIFIIGKLEAITEALYKTLESQYQVQLCHAEEPMNIIKSLAKITKPDMVILNTLESGDINENLFGELRNIYNNIPILMIGNKENCDFYQQYFDGKYISALYRPVASSVILERCARLLGDRGQIEQTKTGAKTDENVKKRILIVDDSAVTLRSVKALLDREYTVAVATSGERAIKEMKKNRPDLVLLDYEMPICDGKETFEMIRQDEEIKDVPVVFLTAVADKMHIASVLQLNPAGYLLKPPNTEVLKETISSILNA